MSGDDWLPIPGASGYELHRDCIRIRSIDRHIRLSTGGLQFNWGKELSAKANAAGYLKTSIRFDDRPRRSEFGMHQLVCLVFHGPPPTPQHEVRHLNGVPSDNRPENLAWGTKSENALDSVRHGTHAAARRTHCKCGREYDIDKGNGRKCSACLKAAATQRKHRDLDETRRRSREQYHRHKDHIREYQRRYYREHREEIRVRQNELQRSARRRKRQADFPEPEQEAS